WSMHMCDYCGSHEHRIPEHTQDHSNTGGSAPVASNGKPIATVDQMAQYLTHGYWADSGRSARSFDINSGGEITVNLSGLDAHGQATARTALQSWTAVSGLQFKEITSRAQITFDDNFSGAFASTGVVNGNVTSSFINVDDGWAKYGSYYLQTFIHEIGHALGLGHAGDYNGSGSYGSDATFANDSWQMSIMSYFSQSQNNQVDASFAYLVTPQLADILAIHNLYGVPTNVETGDTVYGDGYTTGVFGHNLSGNAGVTLVDSGGTDLINLASHTTDDYLSLVAETFSDIGGKRGTIAIARGTVIENATTGSGNDKITGNGADNRLNSGAGHDQILAGGGADVLIGGTGEDTLTGGTGADVFVYSSLDEAGDTIRDFNHAEGDRIDLTDLLNKIGHLVYDPFATGVLQLKEALNGAWLYVQDVKLAFLEGVSATVDGRSLLVTEGLPDAPPPPADPEPVEPDPVDPKPADPEPVAAEPDPVEPEPVEPAPVEDPTNADTNYVITADDILAVDTIVIRDSDGGADTLDFRATRSSATINLDTGVGKVGATGLDIEGDIESLLLGRGHDRVTGSDIDNIIDGGSGRDRLSGGRGDDTLHGGDNNDVLNGGSNDDVLYGEAGKDILNGGLGDDSVYGGAGNDRLSNKDGDDLLDGGTGNDWIRGAFGDDTLVGGSGNDNLDGHHGDDHIQGDDGDDVLNGNWGNDTIWGGDGQDTLRGSRGADVFVFKSSAGTGDTIDDFNHAAGGDQLDIDDLLLELGTDVDSALSSGALSLQDGENGAWLTIEHSSTSPDGGLSSSLNIAYLKGVDGNETLTSDWFL
ncbi:MAG: M10 family metallopeptidase C-terminal domain-containing protein, partial [Pseudomonadota bacterium]